MRTSTSAFAVCKVVASIVHDFFLGSRRPFNFNPITRAGAFDAKETKGLKVSGASSTLGEGDFTVFAAWIGACPGG